MCIYIYIYLGAILIAYALRCPIATIMNAVTITAINNYFLLL